MPVKDSVSKSKSAAVSAPKQKISQAGRTTKDNNQKVAEAKPGPADQTVVSSEAKQASPKSDHDLSALMTGVKNWAGSEVDDSSSSPESGEARRLDLEEGELLSRGRDNPEKITQLQEMLNSGGGSLEVDGLFGPRTAEAVRNFQRENNLQVDGIVGPETLGALNGRSPNENPPSSVNSTDGESTAPASQAGEVDNTTRPEPASANSTTRLQGIPERAEDAAGGRAFMESISHLAPGPERDRAVLNEILSGNIPDSSRNLQELVVNRDGREIRLNATPDYLAIGSDEDNVRVPMTPAVAQAIADRTGTSLPTDRLVDDIYNQSQQLNMAPMSNNRESIGTYIAHDQRIDNQLGSGQAPGQFVSGHKKDLVIPHRDGRVAIYGGRWANGSRIQSYSNVHHDGYEDYSHGARLISQQITIDGQSMRLEDALANPSLRSLFTNQSGAFRY